jgi:ribosomal protein L14
MLGIEEREADISDVIGISDRETIQLGVWKESQLISAVSTRCKLTYRRHVVYTLWFEWVM